MNILAFFAHPDDETMLCGAALSLAAHKENLSPLCAAAPSMLFCSRRLLQFRAYPHSSRNHHDAGKRPPRFYLLTLIFRLTAPTPMARTEINFSSPYMNAAGFWGFSPTAHWIYRRRWYLCHQPDQFFGAQTSHLANRYILFRRLSPPQWSAKPRSARCVEEKRSSLGAHLLSCLGAPDPSDPF